MAKSVRTIKKIVRQYLNKKNKLKTKRSAVKRFKVTGTGKIIVFRANMNHLLAKKSGSRKRKLSIKKVLRGRYAIRAKKLLNK